MTTIYLVRHAEAEGNRFRRIHGQYNSSVTTRGVAQIELLRRRFENIDIDAVYSSDLQRTCQTAQAVYLPKGLPLMKNAGLREVNFGDWEDKPFGGLMGTSAESIADFSTGNIAWNAPGGETLGHVRQRMYTTMRAIAAENPDKTIAVFSHGTAIRQFLTLISSSEEYFPESVNTAVTKLLVDDGTFKIEWYNDASHLGKDPYKAAMHPNTETVMKSRTLPTFFWFRPWNAETERQYYLDCRAEAWMSSHGTMTHYDGDAFLRSALHHSNVSKNAVLVVMSENNRAGMLELDFEKDADLGFGAIPFYYLGIDFRRRGEGVQLLGQAVSAFRALGRSRIRLRCAPENETAYRFYCRNGFEKIGMTGSEAVPLYLMERKINLI